MPHQGCPLPSRPVTGDHLQLIDGVCRPLCLRHTTMTRTACYCDTCTNGERRNQSTPQSTQVNLVELALIRRHSRTRAEPCVFNQARSRELMAISFIAFACEFRGGHTRTHRMRYIARKKTEWCQNRAMCRYLYLFFAKMQRRWLLVPFDAN